jgi:hypothetical protein
MYILFENFRNVDTYFMQRLMAMAVRGEWVHCELIFNEKNNIRASAWDKTGVGIREWETIAYPERFELYPLPSAYWQEAYRICKAQVGTKYDRLGVIGMMYKIPVFHQERNFCSKLCYETIQNYTSLDLPTQPSSIVTPLMLRRMIINQGIKPVPLSVLNN